MEGTSEIPLSSLLASSLDVLLNIISDIGFTFNKLLGRLHCRKDVVVESLEREPEGRGVSMGIVFKLSEVSKK